MAIGAIYESDGFTQAQYDQVHQRTTPGNQPPPGLLYHAAGPTETGFRIIEIWESQEAIQAFLGQGLGAALREAGWQGKPPTFFRVTNIMQR